MKDTTDFTSLIKNDSHLKDLGNKVIISSKANTLQALQPLLKKSRIELLYSFTISDWKNQRPQILEKIQSQFSPSRIVVRSSAVAEDTPESSLAGCFESFLNIDSTNLQEIETTIQKVLRSYKEKNAESSLNQVIIQ